MHACTYVHITNENMFISTFSGNVLSIYFDFLSSNLLTFKHRTILIITAPSRKKIYLEIQSGFKSVS